jgi:hypothetical protein
LPNAFNLDDVVAEALKQPIVDIFVEKAPAATDNSMDISIESYQQLSGEPALFVAIIEKEIFETQGTGSNVSIAYENVLKKILPNAGGVTIDLEGINTSGTQTLSVEIPSIFYYRKEEAAAILFVQDRITQEIYQTIKLDVDVPDLVGLDETLVNVDDYKIYPNPASGQFYLRSKYGYHSTDSYVITNSAGQEISSGNFLAGSSTKLFDIKGYPKGVYLIQINTDNGVVSKKLVIE